jgi:N,N'-diacetyllegionaminate synthase
MRTLIIAEAGVNHNGDLDLARQLIDAAADAGADMVKFQTFSADRLASRIAPLANYQKQGAASSFSQHEMLRRLELDRPAHETLIAHAGARKIRFFSSGFDLESVRLLAELGLDRFKVPSGEITNLPYLKLIGSYRKPVILSTGMATMGEIEAAIGVLEAAGTSRQAITVLHCNTEYPTPMDDVNLRAMCTIGQAFGVQVGYSDHTCGIEVAVAAVALGARIIEKHLTISRELPGPDHKASLEPHELKDMVAAIRNIEQALGDGIKRPTPSESRNRPIARKSLVSSQPIRKGEFFTPENMTVKRPGTGLSPMLWDEMCGRTAQRDYQLDELIER